MATVLDRTALILSYLWETMALLLSAGRMAALRLKSRQTRYQMTLGLEEDYAFLCATIRMAQRMEEELFHSNLAFAPSRRAAVAAYQEALKRLRQRVAQDFAPDKLAPESGRRQDPPDGEAADYILPDQSP